MAIREKITYGEILYRKIGSAIITWTNNRISCLKNLFFLVRCDESSHCPLTNAKEVNKCTVYSKRVCDGCLDGYFLNPGTEGCEECSSPCSFNKIETRPCTTDHDRTCSPKAFVPTILATSKFIFLTAYIFICYEIKIIHVFSSQSAYRRNTIN